MQRAKRLSLIPPYLFGEIARLKAQAIAEGFGFEMAELRRTTIDDDVLALVDESVARQFHAIRR